MRATASSTRRPGAGLRRGGSAWRASGTSLRRRAGRAARSCRDYGRGARCRLYTNLITSAVGITTPTLDRLGEVGLDHVQISVQDSEPAGADRIAGYDGAFVRKRALAAEVVRLKIPLTINVVVHRANIERIADMVGWALALGASRVEIAHVQYYGWALQKSRRADAERAQVASATRGGRRIAPPSSRQDRHRCGGAGLLRAAAEAVRRRLGPPLA